MRLQDETFIVSNGAIRERTREERRAHVVQKLLKVLLEVRLWGQADGRGRPNWFGPRVSSLPLYCMEEIQVWNAPELKMQRTQICTFQGYHDEEKIHVCRWESCTALRRMQARRSTACVEELGVRC